MKQAETNHENLRKFSGHARKYDVVSEFKLGEGYNRPRGPLSTIGSTTRPSPLWVFLSPSLTPTVQPAPAARLNYWLSVCVEKMLHDKNTYERIQLCRGELDLLGFANHLADVCVISRRHQHARLEFRWNIELSHILLYLALFATHSDRCQHLQQLASAKIAVGRII